MSSKQHFTGLWQLLKRPLDASKNLIMLKNICQHTPCLVPCPLWWVNSKWCLVEAGVRVVFRDSECQRVPRTRSHSRGHCRCFGLHGNQGAPGGDWGAVPLLYNKVKTKTETKAVCVRSNTRMTHTKYITQTTQPCNVSGRFWFWVLFFWSDLFSVSPEIVVSIVFCLNQLFLNAALMPDCCVVTQ